MSLEPCASCLEYQRGEVEDQVYLGMKLHVCDFTPDGGMLLRNFMCVCGCKERVGPPAYDSFLATRGPLNA